MKRTGNAIPIAERRPRKFEPPESHREEQVLVAVLPSRLQEPTRSIPLNELLEVVMDLGRIPEARLSGEVLRLSDEPVKNEDIRHVLREVGQFSEDNRAGIERTLHRISAIRNRQDQVIGLTLRVGRAIFGTIDILKDLVETGKNVLLLGRPGIGKTTKLREVARVLADDFGKRVIVIDTSNEIAGDGDVPHPAIGSARRMQVPRPDRQHSVMIEAVENHMPEVIIVDEIGTEAEAAAARTIAERGVQLIGTAHGTTLENLVMNPTVSDLVGGVHTVTLSDEEARRRRTTKTINERRSPPTFDVIIEIVDRSELLVHRDTAEAVDLLLSGTPPHGERRRITSEGDYEVEERAKGPRGIAIPHPATSRAAAGEIPSRIYAYAISRELLDRVLRNLGAEAETVDDMTDADLILALRSREGDAKLRRFAEKNETPIHFVRKNSSAQMRKALQDIFLVVQNFDTAEVRDAVRETEHAIQRALNEGMEVSLAPRPAGLRRMQHKIISRYHLISESVGSEPMRHLVIYPA